MAGLFKRLFKAGQAEAHATMDKLEDPVKMTEQGIRDLKSDLEKAMQGLASVKQLSIQAQRELAKAQEISDDYGCKAELLVQKGKDDLALQALNKKKEAAGKLSALTQTAETQKSQADTMQTNVQKIKDTISKYENELVTLKARAKTAEATGKLNKQLAQIDSNGTIAMLEKMKEKVEEKETLAIAYGEMADTPKSVDDEINQALLTDGPSSAQDELAALKAKMGQLDKPE